MAVRSETLQVSGIRCERCVMRLGGALQGLDGLESANANLLGEVMLSWDDERIRRAEIVAALERGGFPVQQSDPPTDFRRFLTPG
jgi:copper chaperone CopZ